MFKLLILTPLPPWHPGGIERLVGEVVRRLKNDFNIEIYCTNFRSRTYRWEDVRTITFKGSTLYRFSLPLLDMLRKSEFDLIHAHCFSTFIPLAAYLARKKFVLNPHFHPQAVANTSLIIPRRFYVRVFGCQVHRHAKLVVCNSNTEKNLISGKFRSPSDKIKMIYNGVDVEKIRSVKPFDTDERIILCVSQLYEYKNLQKAIQVLKYLPKEFRLYVIGKGPYLSELEFLTKRFGLSDRVKFLGYLPDKEVYKWLRTCSVFAHFSKSETFGMTCIEALAAGTPVVVNNDHFGLQETASLFPEIYSVDVAKVSNKQLANVIQNISESRVNVDLSDFDWDNIAVKFKHAYMSALQN